MSETNNSTNEKQHKRSELPKTLGFIMTFAGIFFLIASLFSLLTLFILRTSSGDAESFSPKEIYAVILTITTILTTLAAIYIGIKLIKHLDIGRRLFTLLTVIVMGLSWVKFAYQQKEITVRFAHLPADAVASVKQAELNSTLMVFILPIILILVALLLNTKRSKAALKR